MNTIQLNQLKVDKAIGEGCFGKVWKANYLGTPVAVKECTPTEDSAEFDFVTYFNREAEMLSKARHPNIVQFLGTCVQDDKFYIVTEYIPSGTMKSWLQGGKARKLRTRISFAIDIARALTFLHNCQIIHRDLKPSNLLITENCRVKVCDFGFARIAAQTEEEMRRMSYCGTDEYMAPEILMGHPFDESVDVFGFGIILCELISCQVATSSVFRRQVPGFGIDPNEVRTRATYDCPSSMIDLALRCLNTNPKHRPRMEMVMNTLHDLELNLASSSDDYNHIGTLKGLPMSPVSPLPDLVDFNGNGNGNSLISVTIPGSDLSFKLDDHLQLTDQPSLSKSPPRINRNVIKTPKPNRLEGLFKEKPQSVAIPKYPIKSLLAKDKAPFLANGSVTSQLDGSVGTGYFSSYSKTTSNNLPQSPTSLKTPNTEKTDSNITNKDITTKTVGHRFSIRKLNATELCNCCLKKFSEFLQTTYALKCDDCNFQCHKRCADLAPFNCDHTSPALKALNSLFLNSNLNVVSP